jgi:ankyrin repeat protein
MPWQGRCTPLHLAVGSSHRAIVFLLLSHGADVLSRDRFGCSPMHYVNSITVAKLLVQYGGKVLDYNSVRAARFHWVS